MMLAKLLICSILIFLARGTFITSQTCTTHTQCTNDGESPHTTQQDISPQQNTLIRGKAGPKGLKGEQGERGKTGRSGRDCNEAKLNTKITQIESIVKYNIEALERVTAKNEADITLSHNTIEALERVTAKNEADITNSQNTIEALERVTAKNEADITLSQNEVDDLKTQLNATQINLNQSNERIRTLNDDLNESKNELRSANEKITGMEELLNKIQKSSDIARAKLCGLISNVEDAAITASSIYNNFPGYGTQHSRLFSTSGVGSWCPQLPYEGSWIQIDLETNFHIFGVATQGNDSQGYCVTTYSIAFKTSTSSRFYNIEDQSGTGAKKIFQGNTDRNSVVINDVNIRARYVRIYPLTWDHDARLRFDVLTC